MAPNSSIIANNENEYSVDPNPYAYPYFHSKTTPLLYNLIVTNFGSNDHHQQHQNQDDTSSIISSPQSPSNSIVDVDRANDELNKKFIRKRKIIAKRIHSRFHGHPHEATWVDSCGETALFRFCQLIRFDGLDSTITVHNEDTHEKNTSQLQHDDLMKRIEHLDSVQRQDTSKNDDQKSDNHETNFNSTVQQTLKLILTLDSTPELIFFVFHSFIKTDPNATNVLNKWGETPLHQFVNHCGFCHYAHYPHYQHNGQEGGLSTLFLDTILKASPKSVYQTNFQRSLPLHLACSLNQLNTDQPFSSTDSMVSMDKLLCIPHYYESQQTSTNMHQLNHHHDEHLIIVQRLVEFHYKGVLAIDLNGCTPLFRAVDSIHCSADVVSFLLCQMEHVFVQNEKDSNENDVVGAIHKILPNVTSSSLNYETIRFLMFKAIMGFDKSNQNYDGSIYPKGSRTKDETTKVLSPMKTIWKTILKRRQLRNHIPWLMDGVDASWTSIADVFESIVKQKVELSNYELGPVWNKMMTLIYCAYYGSMMYVKETMLKCPQDLLPLHAAVYCAAPSSVLRLLIHLHPEHLLQRDKNGDTPLVLSIKSPSYEQQWCEDCRNQNDHHNEDGKYSHVEIILTAAPEAAKMKNRNGRLPLHMAIENGMNWSDALEEIFISYPHGAHFQDTANNLLPFMNACHPKGSQRFSSSEHLTNSYLLLRADPSVINGLFKRKN